MSFLTPTETAELLKVRENDVLSLIKDGKLRAVRVGDQIRIRETELERLEITSPAGPPPAKSDGSENGLELLEGARWVATRTGRARFRVAGSISTGAEIWPGRMRYPVKMPKSFMDSLLAKFAGQEVPVGGSFHDAGEGSLGQFLQAELSIKMNPAVYLAALLIDEGYATEGRRRGCVRFRAKNEMPQ